MSLITEKSHVMILNYLNNPTGVVPSYGDVVALAKIAVECDLIVISDEGYEKIVYEGAEHFCLLNALDRVFKGFPRFLLTPRKFLGANLLVLVRKFQLI
jgi:aspartate/methionine/tyrosine aminotransferase